MKESAFNRKIIELCGNDTMAQYKYLKNFDKRILTNSSEEDEWKLFNPNHKNDNIEAGVYLTLRCGYGGIYQMINIWNQKWITEVADGSYTIMYKDIKPYLK